MSEKINWIRVMCFKHNGSIHRVWDKAALIYEDEEKIIISNSKTLIREYDGRVWMAKEPSVSIYYKKRWFNIMGIIREGGVHYYCNMASPCIVEKNIIKYIDYDLDLVKTVDGDIRLLDEEEYKQNKSKYNYGKEIESILQEELKLLKEDAKFGFNDFNDQLIHNSHESFLEIFLGRKYESKVTN